MVEADKSPGQVLGERKRWRKYALIYLNAAGVAFIFFGHRGWRFDMIPMHYLGYVLLLVGVLGFCGVNIWKGGPLDKCGDPTQEEIEEWGEE